MLLENIIINCNCCQSVCEVHSIYLLEYGDSDYIFLNKNDELPQ